MLDAPANKTRASLLPKSFDIKVDSIIPRYNPEASVDRTISGVVFSDPLAAWYRSPTKAAKTPKPP